MSENEVEVSEELIKDIAWHLGVYMTRREGYDYSSIAVNLIALILSAVRDGKLDEALGVVGWGYIECVYATQQEGKVITEYVKIAPDALLQDLRVADTIIALRETIK